VHPKDGISKEFFLIFGLVGLCKNYLFNEGERGD